jgi:hypothetical protein
MVPGGPHELTLAAAEVNSMHKHRHHTPPAKCTVAVFMVCAFKSWPILFFSLQTTTKHPGGFFSRPPVVDVVDIENTDDEAFVARVFAADNICSL